MQGDPDQFKLGYRPEFDGLRAVSVLLVIGSHCGVQGLRGGFVGVDLFFALSGFLITTLLLEEYAREGRIHLLHFYVRRALRLTPSLLLFTGVYYLLAPTLFPIDKQYQLGALRMITYTTNFVTTFGWRGSFVLNHGWTLAMEEQFYLVWPLLLLGLLRYIRSPGRIAALLLLFSTTVLAYRCWVILNFPVARSWARLFHGCFTRADTLALGCMLALLVHSRALRIVKTGWWMSPALLSLAVAIGVYARYAYHSDPWTVSLGFTVAGFLSIAVIYLLLVPSRSPIHLALRFPPIVWVGRISYGIYLWHMPVVRYMQLTDTFRSLTPQAWQTFVLAFAITLTLAVVSYYVVERPILRLKVRFSGRHAVTPAPLPVPVSPVRLAA